MSELLHVHTDLLFGITRIFSDRIIRGFLFAECFEFGEKTYNNCWLDKLEKLESDHISKLNLENGDILTLHKDINGRFASLGQLQEQ